MISLAAAQVNRSPSLKHPTTFIHIGAPARTCFAPAMMLDIERFAIVRSRIVNDRTVTFRSLILRAALDGMNFSGYWIGKIIGRVISLARCVAMDVLCLSWRGCQGVAKDPASGVGMGWSPHPPRDYIACLGYRFTGIIEKLNT